MIGALKTFALPWLGFCVLVMVVWGLNQGNPASGSGGGGGSGSSDSAAAAAAGASGGLASNVAAAAPVWLTQMRGLVYGADFSALSRLGGAGGG